MEIEVKIHRDLVGFFFLCNDNKFSSYSIHHHYGQHENDEAGKKYTVRTEKYPTGEKFATVFEQNHPVLRKKSLSKSP